MIVSRVWKRSARRGDRSLLHVCPRCFSCSCVHVLWLLCRTWFYCRYSVFGTSVSFRVWRPQSKHTWCHVRDAAFFYVCTCCDSVPATRLTCTERDYIAATCLWHRVWRPYVMPCARPWVATKLGFNVIRSPLIDCYLLANLLSKLNSTLPFIRSVKYHKISIDWLACEKSVRLRTVPVPLEGPSFFLSSFVSSFARANCCSIVQCPRGTYLWPDWSELQ